MKVAVYGDSFATGNPDHKDSWWPSLLAKYLQATSYENFAAPGSPLFFSYQNFLKNHHRFDINIVVVTNSIRYTRRFITEKDDYGFIPGLNTVDQMKDWYPEDIEQIKLLEGWFMSLDIEFMDAMQELMLQDMEKRCSNLVLIPSFGNSFSDDRRERMGIGDNELNRFNTIQLKSFGIDRDDPTWRENMHTVSCHMTKETNNLVALAVYSQLKFNYTKWQYPKFIKHALPREHYYINTTKEQG